MCDSVLFFPNLNSFTFFALCIGNKANAANFTANTAAEKGEGQQKVIKVLKENA